MDEKTLISLAAIGADLPNDFFTNLENRELWKIVLELDGNLLRLFPNKIKRSDFELCMIAVKNYPNAWNWIMLPMCENEDICRMALSKNTLIYPGMFMSHKLSHDLLLVIAGLGRSHKQFAFNLELWKIAIKNGCLLKNVPQEIIEQLSREEIIDAVVYHDENYKFIPEKLKNDKFIAIKALEHHFEPIKSFSEEFLNDKRLIVMAILKNEKLHPFARELKSGVFFDYMCTSNALGALYEANEEFFSFGQNYDLFKLIHTHIKEQILDDGGAGRSPKPP